MKKLLLPLLAILLFTACQKQISTEIIPESKTKEKVSAGTNTPDGQIDICHREGNGSWHMITINIEALPAHIAHGDADENCIPTVTICNQVWMQKNLNVDKFSDGTPILHATTDAEWIAAGNAGTGAWCYYNNDPEMGAIYGKLYNWHAVNDPRGLAPAGWHVPTIAEWITLSTCLGGDAVAGGKMKETGTTHWASPNIDATNSSGFTGLPGANRSNDGSFYGVGLGGHWWSTSEIGSYTAWGGVLYYGTSYLYLSGEWKRNGFSVRCVKD